MIEFIEEMIRHTTHFLQLLDRLTQLPYINLPKKVISCGKGGFAWVRIALLAWTKKVIHQTNHSILAKKVARETRLIHAHPSSWIDVFGSLIVLVLSKLQNFKILGIPKKNQGPLELQYMQENHRGHGNLNQIHEL